MRLLFQNFELDKAVIPDAVFYNLAILLFLGVVAVLFMRRRENAFLDFTQTNQVKGMAILLVMAGHIWVHVTGSGTTDVYPVLGDYAVTVFLFMSGYGLSRSLQDRPLFFSGFARKRLIRVMVPYWLCTVIILLFDYFLLIRSYSAEQIIRTLLGINIENTLQRLDYVRWYITVLIIWYLLFYMSHRYWRPFAVHAMVISGIFLAVLSLAHKFPGAPHQVLAFPLGCLLSHYYERVHYYIKGPGNLFKISALVAAGLFIFSSVLFLSDHTNVFADPAANKVLKQFSFYFANNLNGLLFTFFVTLLVAFYGRYNYFSLFLNFCGVISYELFLLHGPLLIKYNFIFPYFLPEHVLQGFVMFFAVTILISWLAHRSFSYITNSFQPGI